MHLIGDVDGNLIVESRRRAKTWSSVVSPENTDETLFWRARAWSVNAVAANGHHFVVSIGILLAAHRRRRRNTELTARLEHERSACAPIRTERDWLQTNRVLAP